MEAHVARQPILDTSGETYAYELLFRSSSTQNWFTGLDPDQASGRVIHSSLLAFDWAALTGQKRAFINLTRQALLERWVLALPAAQTVAEVLETVSPDAEVLAACVELKRAGYALALDDFVYAPEYEPLLDLADFVKVDFRLTTAAEERARLATLAARRPGLRLLAEKVETREDVAQAKELGYRFFQGYFFCRPEILSTREIPPSRVGSLRLLEELNRPEVGFEALEQIVKQDVALSVKLLRFLNSAAFRWSSRVTSIRQALTLLGERPLRQWATVAALASLGEGQPEELVVTSLVRAMFLEQLAGTAGMGAHRLDLFLVGLLSALDALVGRPLEEVLAGLSLRPEVKATLTGQGSSLDPPWQLAQAWERADFEKSYLLAGDLGVPSSAIAEAYRTAVAKAEAIYRAS